MKRYLLLLLLLLLGVSLAEAAPPAPETATQAPAETSPSLAELAPREFMLSAGMSNLQGLQTLYRDLAAVTPEGTRLREALDTLRNFEHHDWRPFSLDWSSIGLDSSRGFAVFVDFNGPREPKLRIALAVTDRERALRTLTEHLQAFSIDVQRQGDLLTLSIDNELLRFDCESPKGWLQCDFGLFEAGGPGGWDRLRSAPDGWISFRRSSGSQPLWDRLLREDPFKTIKPTEFWAQLRGQAFSAQAFVDPLVAAPMNFFTPSGRPSAGLSRLGEGGFFKLSVDLQRLLPVFGPMVLSQVPPPAQPLVQAITRALSGDFLFTADASLLSPVIIIGLESREAGVGLLRAVDTASNGAGGPLSISLPEAEGEIAHLNIRLPIGQLRFPYLLTSDALIIAPDTRSLTSRRVASSTDWIAEGLRSRGTSGAQGSLSAPGLSTLVPFISLLEISDAGAASLNFSPELIGLFTSFTIVSDAVSLYQRGLAFRFAAESGSLSLSGEVKRLPLPGETAGQALSSDEALFHELVWRSFDDDPRSYQRRLFESYGRFESDLYRAQLREQLSGSGLMSALIGLSTVSSVAIPAFIKFQRRAQEASRSPRRKPHSH